MRLKKEQIQKVSDKILKDLEAKKVVVIKTDKQKIIERIQKAITDDLVAEDRLDEDVKDLMDQYRPMIDSGQMNEHDVFQKIKKQLIKERKLVL